MFERITLDRSGVPGAPIDLGVMAECLVFYHKVRVIVDQVRFKYLVRCCVPEELLDLLSRGVLELEYFEDFNGVITKDIGRRKLYDRVHVQSPSLKYLDVSRSLFDELARSSGKGANKRFIKFARLVKRSSYALELLPQERADWLDESYTTEAARVLLALLAPGYVAPEPLDFLVHADPNGFEVISNINFDDADAAYRLHTGTAEHTITAAYLLSQIADARRHLVVGSQLGSEFALAAAAKRFFEKVFSSPANPIPRVINVDKNPAYPAAVHALKAAGILPRRVRLRQCKYLNNVIEQDHRTVKKRTWLAKGYGSFQGASRTLESIETMSMIRKRRVRWVAKSDVVAEARFCAV